MLCAVVFFVGAIVLVQRSEILGLILCCGIK
jgi:hypothetical protein